MNKQRIRKFFYSFVVLPSVRQFDLAKQLNIFEREDIYLSTSERTKVYTIRAWEAGLYDVLEELTEVISVGE